MDAENLQRDIDRELLHSPPLDNAHGITLENIGGHRVTPPVFTRFENAGIPDASPETDAWIVLDECPNSDSQGYLVVYHADSRVYGLAVKNDGNSLPVFLGCYGSLVEALNAM